MGFNDLRGLLHALEERNELVRVNEELSPILEIPEFLRQVMYRSGPAILFEKVKDHPGWRVAGNIFGSMDRIKIALGVEKLEDIGWRLVGDLWKRPPYSMVEKLKAVKSIVDFSRYLPRKTRKPLFDEVVVEGSKINLYALPAFKTWPRDGGRYITFGQVYTVDPNTGVVNIGVYRVMVKTPRQLVVHWQMHKRGRVAYKDSHGDMPVAVVIGGDPAAMLAGVMPAPYPMDKLLFAGVMNGKGVEVWELPSGIPVPAGAEVVIEGHAKPGWTSGEGPFGDHWGYYDKPHESFPVVKVERIWMRDDPIFVGTVVGKPPLEDAFIGKAVERIFLPIVKTVLPEIVEMNFPVHGVFQGLLIVSIKKRYPGHGKKVINALWGLGQTSLTKIIIVVDEDIDPHNLDHIIWAVSSHVDPQRDIIIQPASHTDQLDPATPMPGYGSKLGIDATRKLPEEYNGRMWPEEVKPDPSIAARIKKLVDRLLSGDI